MTTPSASKKASSDNEPAPIQFRGRVERSPDGQAVYAWSGAGFVARFRGTGAVIRLKDDKNQHQVLLDGHPLPKLVARADTDRYEVANGLAPGEHRIEVYRRTEALFGPTRFLGIEVQGGALIPREPPAPRRIELIGDSISCGYGNEGATAECAFSADTENHYQSYGALVARTFGAELSTIAWSGRGVVKNHAGEAGEKMGALYERVLPETSSSRWAPQATYDAVIVNLGTNDYSTEPDPAEDTFVSAYVSLLQRIRQNSPKAFVLCTVGPMLFGEDLERAQAAIDKAVALRRAEGDTRITLHRMQTANENPGCDWHPGLATHQRMADELIPLLRAALGW